MKSLISGAVRGRVSTNGVRENNAARSLEEKGLVKFVNQSRYISPRNSNKRNHMGDYVGFYSVCGYIEKNT